MLISWVVLTSTVLGSPSDVQNPLSPVVIDYFYEPGCPACLRVQNEVLPELRLRYEGFYVLNRYDTGVASNVIRLVAYQEALGIEDNSSVSMFVDYATPLCGIEAIRTRLAACLDKRVNARFAPEWEPPQPIAWGVEGDTADADARVSRFTVSVVAMAGFLDGINPCAISTLVLLMSMLVVAGLRGRGILIMGSAFVLASFSVYTAIGFGLLRCLHLLTAFPTLAAAFRRTLAGVLLLLAFLSFRDAFRYGRTHDPHQVLVQLPERIKRMIHSVVRRGVRSHHLVVSGIVAGATVTALETVCTGQVYVPAMTLVIREGGGVRVWGLLLLYNTMFISPLILAIALTRFGLKTETMLRWSRSNVAFSKALLGFFFLFAAVYLLS